MIYILYEQAYPPEDAFDAPNRRVSRMIETKLKHCQLTDLRDKYVKECKNSSATEFIPWLKKCGYKVAVLDFSYLGM